jgi:glycosyltransferase involved in cell wall biosynthesis
MKVGYLHLGSTEHGINRYGKMLADASRQKIELTVEEVELLLKDDPIDNREMLINAAQQLSQGDLVHIQFSSFNDSLWGSGWTQLVHLRMFLNHCHSPVVVTLHDVYYYPRGLKGFLNFIRSQLRILLDFKFNNADAHSKSELSTSRLRILVRTVKDYWNSIFGPATTTLNVLIRNVDLVLVCSQEEVRRLDNRVPSSKLKIIPHFVEPRSPSITADEARQSLNLVGKIVLTILGFVFSSKGHQLLIDALPDLPSDIEVVFAGNAEVDKEFVKAIKQTTDEKGLSNRLRFTGYLSEQDLESYLLATDLAVCAFKEFSASGSISTWLSVGCPILAFELPQIREYNEIEPGAIQVFAPYTSDALLKAIQVFLDSDRAKHVTKIENLGKNLSMFNIMDRHLSVYYSLGKTSKSSSISLQS